MQQRWTLEIEKFGRIEKASIEISPFMLFVGDNNSGKSYVMSLLWGILAIGDTLFPAKAPGGRTYKTLDQWLQAQLPKGHLAVSEDILQLFVQWFNEILKQRKDELVSRIFGYGMSIGSVQLSGFRLETEVEARIVRIEDVIRVSLSGRRWGIALRSVGEQPSVEQRFSILRQLLRELVLGDLGQSVLSMKRALVGGLFGGLSGPLYLPASRTGFMLAFKTLMQNLVTRQLDMIDELESEATTARFSLPTSRFLQALMAIDIRQEGVERPYGSVVEMLEQEIMHGYLVRDASPVPNYSYHPIDSERELPLHVTSSLVTELSPILVFLKSDAVLRLMMIEEPEAHLHPHMQRMMARALVRLVNLGLPIWATTHSDTLFQQVNFLIQLNGHARRDEMAKRFGYIDEEYLSHDVVRVYQFTVVSDGTTQIEALPCSPYGFPAETFNRTISSLSEEILFLQESASDAD